MAHTCVVGGGPGTSVFSFPPFECSRPSEAPVLVRGTAVLIQTTFLPKHIFRIISACMLLVPRISVCPVRWPSSSCSRDVASSAIHYIICDGQSAAFLHESTSPQYCFFVSMIPHGRRPAAKGGTAATPPPPALPRPLHPPPAAHLAL